MRLKTISTLVLALGMSACATTYSVTPIPGANQQVRYSRGVPTEYSEMANSAVQVTPLGLNDDGQLVIAVAAFNKSQSPINFGIENLSLTADANNNVKIFTYEEMVREAENKATWAKVAIVLAGIGSAAAANANAYSTTNGFVSTPYGTSSFYSRTYDPGAAYAGTAAAAAGTAYGLNQIQGALDNTLARLDNQILRTTTIDPGASTGGMAVADSLGGSYPHNISLALSIGGDEHVLQFVITKGDQAPPPVAPSVKPAFETQTSSSSSSSAGPQQNTQISSSAPASQTSQRPCTQAEATQKRIAIQNGYTTIPNCR